MYDKLVTKLNKIDTNGFVLKTKYDTGKSELAKKFLIPAAWLKKTNYNAKITEIEKMIRSISSLFTNSALTLIELKIPDDGNLITKNRL